MKTRKLKSFYQGGEVLQVSGTNIFTGAYAARRQETRNHMEISEESIMAKAQRFSQEVNSAYRELGLDKRAATVFVSKEDMAFLCSEEGFLKMKQDAIDLYEANLKQQHEIAQGRDSEDVFWAQTGNQWLIFSELLYNEGCYENLSDEDVKSIEEMLDQLTSGMSNLSRSQYLTGMDFSVIKEEYKVFPSESEILLELESSVAALTQFSQTKLSGKTKEKFCELIELYRVHNEEILKEYENPVEGISRAIARSYTNSCNNETALQKLAESKDGKCNYNLMMNLVENSEDERSQYRKTLQMLFEKMMQKPEESLLQNEISGVFATYATGQIADGAFRAYVLESARYLFQHMSRSWKYFY